VKIGKSMLSFESRKWSRGDGPCTSTNPLEAEHPTFVRVLEGMCVGTDLGLAFAPDGGMKQAAAGLGALTAAGMAVWGVNKWRNGETALDRIEAAGSLALSVGYGVNSANVFAPLGKVGERVSNAAMCTYAASDLFLGGVDAVRGVRESDKPRLISGLAQISTGACVAGMTLFPGASTPLLLAMVGSIAVRQLAVGAPGERLAG